MVVDYFRMFTNILPGELKNTKSLRTAYSLGKIWIRHLKKQAQSLFSERILNIRAYLWGRIEIAVKNSMISKLLVMFE
jgi:hypothetical protein